MKSVMPVVCIFLIGIVLGAVPAVAVTPDIVTNSPESENQHLVEALGQARKAVLAAKDREVVAAYSRVLKLAPKSLEAYGERASSYEALGEKDKCRIDYTRAVSLKPANARERLFRGDAQAWIDKGQKTAGSLNDFVAASDAPASNAYEYFVRGRAEQRMDEPKKAVEDYTQTIRLSPEAVAAFNNRGVAESAISNYKEAINDFTEVIRINPQDPDAYANRAYAYISLNEYKKGVEDCTEALRLNPNDEGALEHRGFAYNRMNRPVDAIKDCNEAIQLDPEDASPYISRATAYRALGRETEARRDDAKVKSLKARFNKSTVVISQ